MALNLRDHLAEVFAPERRFALLTWRFVREKVFGLHGGTTGSRRRRFAIRACLYWSIVYVFTSVLRVPQVEAFDTKRLFLAAVMLMAVSTTVFIVIVLLMPFRDRAEFRINPKRLLGDTIVSSLFCIAVFSLLYRSVGLVSGGNQIVPDAATALYFSTVTFSTLGYGDFAPSVDLRLVASAQALIGNLHLGMIVGSTFAAIRDQVPDLSKE
ncbi:potassium channel family protein [Epibacterium ulvae]|uniref:potassium channel family protein n=1 Tax=Epibacterium ulvae TaxID=1156985 RepID=UPI0024931D7C|nr:potassium channel family protein [Epibacterium ulvae]